MSFGWLRDRIQDQIQRLHLTLVERWGRWYVHPLGEQMDERSPGRRCFTRWGANYLKRQFEITQANAEDDWLEECREDGVEGEIEGDVVWVVSRWLGVPSAAVEDLMQKIEENLSHGRD